MKNTKQLKEHIMKNSEMTNKLCGVNSMMTENLSQEQAYIMNMMKRRLNSISCLPKLLATPKRLNKQLKLKLQPRQPKPKLIV
jgi:predicted metallopeptidase